MEKHNARIVMMITALIGLAISAYLFYVYVTGGPILCGLASHGCNTVRASKWAYIGPIPRPALGIAYYTAFLGLLILETVFVAKKKEFNRLILGMAVIGVLESAYLVGIQAFIIQAYCIWCLGSAVCTLVLLAAILLTKKK